MAYSISSKLNNEENFPKKVKTNCVKGIIIPEHERFIHQYIYAGICKNCNQAFERYSFGFRFPVYCGSCSCLTSSQRKKYQKNQSLTRIK